jgi:hypothetical protein
VFVSATDAMADREVVPNSRTEWQPSDALTGLLFIIVGGLAIFWIAGWRAHLLGIADFRQLYVSGYMVRTGEGSHIYDYNYQLELQNRLTAPIGHAVPFVRPAFQAALFAPFSYFSYRTAYLLWLCLNFGLAVMSWLILRRLISFDWSWKPLPALTFFLFAPLQVALVQGQDSILWLLLFLLGMTALKDGRGTLAGALLACGLFKFQLTLPLIAVLAIWRYWPVIRGFIAAGVALAGISIAILGKIGLADLYHHRFAPNGLTSDYFLMANLHAFIAGVAGDSRLITWVSAVLSGLFVLIAAYYAPQRNLMLAGTIAALGSFYLFPHDWTLLIVPDLYLLRERNFDGWIGLAVFLGAFLQLFFWHYSYLFTLPLFGMWLSLSRSRSEHRQNDERFLEEH